MIIYYQYIYIVLNSNFLGDFAIKNQQDVCFTFCNITLWKGEGLCKKNFKNLQNFHYVTFTIAKFCEVFIAKFYKVKKNV